MKTWYLLFGGSSPDGRGRGIYEGRTTDKQVALDHFRKLADNPYSTGMVQIVKDNKIQVARSEGDFSR